MQLKINKAIRLSNKFHLRILHLDGPIVSWYRYETNQTKNTKKGSFDLRKCQNDQGIPKNFPSEIQIDSNKQVCTITINNKTVKDEITNSNKNENESKFIIFTNDPIKSLNDKTIKDIFEEIKQYYSIFFYLFNKNKIDFQKLRFLSDPKITSIFFAKDDTNNDIIKILINNFEWHTNLIYVHLKGYDKRTIETFFNTMKISKKIFLQEIRIESTANTRIFNLN